MSAPDTDLALLDDPVARELLASRQMARLAYTWTDGTPRVVPIGFHWTGEAVVMGTPVRAPKLKALAADPRVAITIDSEQSFPFKALLLRGTAETDSLDDVSPEYEASIHRYMGQEAGEAWLAGLRGQPMVRITVRPAWACILDFVTRFPSALSA
jgi:hypothetical protein